MARGKFAHAYYPASYKKWRAEFLEKLPEEGGTTGFTVPVHVFVTFVCTKPRTTKLLTPKGDIDNYIKSVLDALTDAAVWDDDKLVETIHATKRFAEPGESAGIQLSIVNRRS